MRYLPKSPADRDALLKAIGARSIDDLFASHASKLVSRSGPQTAVVAAAGTHQESPWTQIVILAHVDDGLHADDRSADAGGDRIAIAERALGVGCRAAG